MAVFDTGRIIWTYESDNGMSIPYRTQVGYSSQSATIGGASGSAINAEPKRYGLKQRVAIVLADNHVRRVPIFTKAAYAALVPGTSTILVNVDGQAVSGTVRSLEGERHRGAGYSK